METLSSCCRFVTNNVTLTIIYGIFLLGFSFFISLVIIGYRISSSPISATLSEKSWKRNTMDDCEVNRRRYVYLFNWTNTQDFITKNKVPELREIGPFVFYEEVKLLNLTWADDGVSYNRKTSWYFNKNDSLSLDLNITHLNPIAALTIYKAQNISNPLTQREFDYIIEKKDNVIITKTIRELLFESLIDKSFKPLKISSVEKFGWLDTNNTIEGLFTLSSNSKLTINKSTVLFDASDQLRVSIINKSCRSILFNASISNIYSGYDVDLNCWNKSSESLPISISLPHYLDHQIIGIKGLSPSPKLHRPAITFDYESRVRLQTNITYQLNMKIAPISWSHTFLKNLTSVDVPMIWFKDISRMPDTIWDDIALDKQIYKKKVICTSLGAVSFIVVLISIGTIVFKYFVSKNNRTGFNLLTEN